MSTLTLIYFFSILGLVIAQPGAPTCSAYCSAYTTSKCTLKDSTDTTQCEAGCALLTLGDSIGGTDNTLGCRQGQLDAVVAAEDAQCIGASFISPACGSRVDLYCDLMASACPTVYPTLDSCKKTAAQLVVASTDVPLTGATGDNLQCRIYHAANAALTANKLHCTHASIGGAGVCFDTDQKRCENFCNIYSDVCGFTAGSSSSYADLVSCVTTCLTFDYTDRSYDKIGTNAANANTYACREYHLTAAVGNKAVHCPHAGGDGAGVCATAEKTCSKDEECVPTNKCKVSSCDTLYATCTSESDKFCDDDDACTSNSCNPSSGCVFIPLDPCGGDASRLLPGFVVVALALTLFV